MRSFDYNYQNALRQAIVFSIFFFCEESLAYDTNQLYKDRSEMHSGSCSQMMSTCIWSIGNNDQPRPQHPLPENTRRALGTRLNNDKLN